MMVRRLLSMAVMMLLAMATTHKKYIVFFTKCTEFVHNFNLMPCFTVCHDHISW